jgi:uncharacterized membrane protein YfcA
MRDLLLPLLGFAVGALGTLVGAGGGFVLVPFLLFFYPDDQPEVITTISLAVVFLNAVSGSVAYARQRRIDYRTGLLFAAATIPGSVLGAYAVRFIPRGSFNVLFGLLLVAIAVLVALRPTPKARAGGPRPGETARTLRDRYGHTYQWSFRPLRGTALSFFIGFLSSALGIGGGIIHVPTLVLLLSFPVHVAAATSQFILAIMAFSGTLTHVLAGEFGEVWWRTLLIGAGVVVGAQLGSALAVRARPVLITRALAAGLLIVGSRLLLGALIG